MADETRSVCLTFDFDGLSLAIGSLQNTTDMGLISRGELGQVGAQRLLALAKKLEVPMTFCVPGHTAYCYPDLIKRILDEGHEIVHHGWVHENPLKFTREGEKRNLERGLEALEYATGQRPRGYRAPAWNMSEHSIDLLFELGFEYDSSFSASDLYPYYLRKGDIVSLTQPYVFGELCEMVEIPVNWAADDWPAFEFIFGMNTGLKTPAEVRAYWQADFDYLVANCPGGVYDLTCHPQVIGRGGRLMMYEDLVKYMKAADNVRFETLGQVADRFRAAHPLDQWKKENPYYAGTGAFSGEVK
jgi:peptidoglycan-N-acetylglucosamine deacetylase